MKKILVAVIGLVMGVMMVGAPVMAAGTTCGPNEIHVSILKPNGTECIGEDQTGAYIKWLIGWVVGILTGAVVVAAVVGMIISGIQYTTAAGNEQQMAKAKKRIVQIAIGLVIWVFMWAALNWLIPGFKGTEFGL